MSVSETKMEIKQNTIYKVLRKVFWPTVNALQIQANGPLLDSPLLVSMALFWSSGPKDTQ